MLLEMINNLERKDTYHLGILRVCDVLLGAESRRTQETNTIPATIDAEQPHNSVPGMALSRHLIKFEKEPSKSCRAFDQR